jgi:tetratricopeptide (TPR) repeat protein
VFTINRRKLALLTAGAALYPGAALAQGVTWRRAEGGGFIVYSPGAETRLRGVVHDLESLDGLLRHFSAAPAQSTPAAPLEVYLCNGRSQFLETFPNARPDLVGFYQATPDIVAAYGIFSDTSGFSSQEVLFHEYAHHFMFQHFATAYPTWYTEGFAEFVSTTTFTEDHIILGRASTERANTLNHSTWLPMQQLLTASPWQMDMTDTDKFYAQSWLFVHYIVMTPGARAKFVAYNEALARGTETIAALQAAFGMSPTDMERTLRIYLANRPNGLSLGRPPQVAHEEATVTVLPPSAGTLLPISTRVRRGVANADEAALLARVRQLVGATPADRFALMTLARTEATIGDRERARALLGPYVQAHADDVEALYLMGLSYYTDAEKLEGEARRPLLTQARHYFVQANRLDENNVAVLYRYAATFAEVSMDDATFNNTINVLLLAHQIAPQVTEIGFYVAQWLMSANRNAEAVNILRPIAYDPHGGEGAHRALELMQQAEHAASSAAPGNTQAGQSGQAQH